MARLTVLCWRGIPSMVEAKDAGGSHKIRLSDRFQELIDMAAMRSGLAGSDAYLEEWRRERRGEREGEARAVAEDLALEIEAEYEHYRAAVIALSR